MTRRVWAVALLAAALVSCGGGKSVDPDEDDAFIEDALLTVDDLPDGFRAEPVDDDENDAADVCNQDVLSLEPGAVDDAKTAETDSVQFQSDTLSIRAQITSFDDAELPQRLIEAFVDGDDYLDCFVDKFRSEQADDITVEGVDVDNFPIDDDAVDAGVTLVVQLNVGGVAAEARQYLALVDRYAVSLDVTARAEDMDADVAVDALDEIVVRLSAD